MLTQLAFGGLLVFTVFLGGVNPAKVLMGQTPLDLPAVGRRIDQIAFKNGDSKSRFINLGVTAGHKKIGPANDLLFVRPEFLFLALVSNVFQGRDGFRTTIDLTVAVGQLIVTDDIQVPPGANAFIVPRCLFKSLLTKFLIRSLIQLGFLCLGCWLCQDNEMKVLISNAMAR